jgi:hypothetical protein
VKIEKYTFGTGDRFAHQGRAQLQAILKAREAGIDVHPESQFAALERPSDAIAVDARLPFQDVVEQIVNALKQKQPAKDG